MHSSAAAAADTAAAAHTRSGSAPESCTPTPQQSAIPSREFLMLCVFVCHACAALTLLVYAARTVGQTRQRLVMQGVGLGMGYLHGA